MRCLWRRALRRCMFARVRGRLARRRRLTIGALAGLAVLLAACTSIVRASVANDGTQGNGISWFPSLSHDGRYVAFESSASNLVPGDTNNVSDIFVRDLVAKTIVRVSVNSNGVQADRNSSRRASTTAVSSSPSSLTREVGRDIRGCGPTSGTRKQV